MVTEKTALLTVTKSFDYLSNVPILVSNGSNDCVIVVCSCDKMGRENIGMTLEELMPYQDDPWWQCFRRIIIISFWLTLAVIIIMSCIISIDEVNKQHCLINAGTSTVGVISTSGGVLTSILSSSSQSPDIDASTMKNFNLSFIGS